MIVGTKRDRAWTCAGELLTPCLGANVGNAEKVELL